MNKDHNIINPTGIHLDIKHIQSSYKLLTIDYNDDEKWFSSFECGIDKLQIGNTDDYTNKVKALQKKLNENTHQSKNTKRKLEQAEQTIKEQSQFIKEQSQLIEELQKQLSSQLVTMSLQMEHDNE